LLRRFFAGRRSNETLNIHEIAFGDVVDFGRKLVDYERLNNKLNFTPPPPTQQIPYLCFKIA
jgi:hypothetical protein